MTIPKGTEQWECDLIAPSAAPGLLPCPFCGSSSIDPKQWRSMDNAGPGCDNCGACAETIEIWNTRAAGQAHPQGQVYPPGEHCLACGQSLAHDDAAPAASQAAPAAVAEPLFPAPRHTKECNAQWQKGGVYCTCPTPAPDPAATAQPYCTCGHDGKLTSADCPIHGTAPAKAQEPDDERNESARSDALVQRLRYKNNQQNTGPLYAEAADHIEQLQAQHEADAAELKRQNDANDMLAEERDAFQARAATLHAQHEADAARIADLEWSAKMSAQTSEGAYNGVAILLHEAQAARDEALSSLAEAERLLRDVPDDDPGSIVWTRIRVFLARPLILAQADERSKGADCS